MTSYAMHHIIIAKYTCRWNRPVIYGIINDTFWYLLIPEVVLEMRLEYFCNVKVTNTLVFLYLSKTYFKRNGIAHSSFLGKDCIKCNQNLMGLTWYLNVPRLITTFFDTQNIVHWLQHSIHPIHPEIYRCNICLDIQGTKWCYTCKKNTKLQGAGILYLF